MHVRVERRVRPGGHNDERNEMPSFDTEGFDKALRECAQMRGKDMKQVSAETGVSETTLSRMHNHRRAPDAASLAALSAWAGLNPARFSGLVLPTPRAADTKAANTRLKA
jgi:transcriptional regulator with XRE-family HTH domain